MLLSRIMDMAQGLQFWELVCYVDEIENGKETVLGMMKEGDLKFIQEES